MKATGKIFVKTLRRLEKRYENDSIAEAASTAEVDRNKFWRIFKNKVNPKTVKVRAVLNNDEVVVHDLPSILEVWRKHFSQLSTPKNSELFDKEHYDTVTRRVREWSLMEDRSPFLVDELTPAEVEKAIKKLHLKKAPGHDNITAEHLRYGGYRLIQVLCWVYNACIKTEYVPHNFRIGVQIPLHKGKNTCPLKPDNYRGITLLSCFNKLFEMLIWQRIEDWWVRTHVISELQGACRRGSSCIHTALTLQETISMQREGGKKVFVAYFDVSKAFDSVWIDGLFYQLYELGVTGSLWRILYRCYVNFTCQVRVGGCLSAPYPMNCGIHQGGFLSLVKYVAFVNSLLVQLKESALCCAVAGVQTTPLGYADDLATCTLSGNKMSQVLQIVEQHGRTWRYTFNAGKSGVMVYGENNAEMRIGMDNRMFSLEGMRVKEKFYYEHVGIKACLKGDTHTRTTEKIKKARKVLNMATCLGIKRGGLNMATCCLIFWTVVIPTLCYGCEIWVLKPNDISLLETFQRYCAKRIQRLHPRSLNATCMMCLGWINIVRLIMVKKMMFARTIYVMDEVIPIKQVLVERTRELNGEGGLVDNPYDSPITEIINTSINLGLCEHLQNFANGNIMSKPQWKKKVWAAAWGKELEKWQEIVDTEPLSMLRNITTGPTYSIWWQLSDLDPTLVKKCEVMVKLICKASKLKYDDPKLKRKPFAARMCVKCNLASRDDARHMVMQCLAHGEIRGIMHDEIERICPNINPLDYFDIIMGKFIEDWEFADMVPIWEVSCRHISEMYRRSVWGREGVG